MGEFNLQPQEQTQEQQQDNRRLMELKSILGGNRLLVILILLLVGTVLSCVSDLMPKTTVKEVTGDVIEEYGFMQNSVFNDVVNADTIQSTSDTIGTIFSVAITGITRGLAAVGFILVWLSVRNADNSPISSTGLSLLHVMNKLGFIGYWILLGLLAIALLITLIVLIAGGALFAIVVLFLIVFVGAICGGVIVLMILRNRGLEKAIDKVSGISEGTESRYDIEIGGVATAGLYVSSVCAAILCLTNLSSMNLLAIIFNGCFCAYYFLLARLVADIRDTI